MKACSLSVILAAILSSPATAQLAQNDLGTHSMVYKYNDVTKIGETKTIKNYDDVHGRYLWSKDYHRALVIMKPGNMIRMQAARINYYTNEIQYPSKENEMASSIKDVKRIFLYSNDPSDTTLVVATFDVLPDLQTRQPFFCQILNNGKIQLLKRVNVKSHNLRVDPIQNRDTYYFYTATAYFIRNQAILEPIKTLNRSNLYKIIPEASSNKEWLSSKRNKLKNEKDVIAFLDHLNSQDK
jgi:hypothetical protein